jgi:hypothetical protein
LLVAGNPPGNLRVALFDRQIDLGSYCGEHPRIVFRNRYSSEAVRIFFGNEGGGESALAETRMIHYR